MMTDPDGRPAPDDRELNRYQRTALTVTLEQLEQSVGEIERLLDGPPAGATYEMTLDLPPAAVWQLRDHCQACRRQGAEMAAAFDLPRRRSSVRWMIAAEMSGAWAHLEDLRPPRSRRYGHVDPVRDETLIPRLEQLVRLVLAVGNSLPSRRFGSDQATNRSGH